MPVLAPKYVFWIRPTSPKISYTIYLLKNIIENIMDVDDQDIKEMKLNLLCKMLYEALDPNTKNLRHQVMLKYYTAYGEPKTLEGSIWEMDYSKFTGIDRITVYYEYDSRGPPGNTTLRMEFDKIKGRRLRSINLELELC